MEDLPWLAFDRNDCGPSQSLSMKLNIRVYRSLIERIRSDLSRSHPHALERVGFIFGRIGNSGQDEVLALLSDYASLDDSTYIRNSTVGACIGREAICNVMERVLKTGECAFHVHIHDHKGKPTLSYTDKSSLLPLTASFRNVCGSAIHGVLLLSQNDCTAVGWIPAMTRPVYANTISIVGYPYDLHGARR